MEHKAEQTAKHGKPGHSKAIGYLCAAVGAATFGLIPLFANTAILAGIHNDTILAYRYSIAALSYALYLLLRRKSLRISHSQAKEVLLAGVFGYGITATFLMASYLYMPTGIATSIHFLYPVVVTILMAVFLQDQDPGFPESSHRARHSRGRHAILDRRRHQMGRHDAQPRLWTGVCPDRTGQRT